MQIVTGLFLMFYDLLVQIAAKLRCIRNDQIPLYFPAKMTAPVVFSVIR